MSKLVIKNLWSHRRRNGWLLAELILVTVVSWVIFDPIVVITSDLALPIGYDADRLCMVSLGTLDPRAPGYDESRADSMSMAEDYIRLIDRIKQRADVECATPINTWTYMNSPGNSMSGFDLDTTQTNTINANLVYYHVGHDYFTTYGIKPVAGCKTSEELSSISMGENDMIVTKTFADRFFPNENPIGKIIPDRYQGKDARIVAVVEDVRVYTLLRSRYAAFKAQNMYFNNPDLKILVRVKPGVELDSFAEELKDWMVKEMQSGNLFALSAETYPELSSKFEYQNGGNVRRLNVILAIFFMVNLCLGVVGTFWLQTRSRSEDAGIMRSFGATPSMIMRMLIGEGVLLTIIAWAVGCFAYLQWALAEGLSYGANWWNDPLVDGVLTHFWPHFAIVSAVVLVLLVAVVVIGIYIPARRISRVNPVEALREN